MSARPIRITHWKLGRIAKDPEGGSARTRRTKALGFKHEPGWAVLGFFGWLLALVGGVDLLLTVYPPERNPEWEFATAVALISGLPVPTMGLALIIASALKRRARNTAKFAGTVALLGSLSIAVGLVIFMLTIPVAMRMVQNPLVRGGIIKAIVKTWAQGSLYMIGMFVLGFQAWRQSRQRAQASPDQSAESATT
jgi:hypothetical protein